MKREDAIRAWQARQGYDVPLLDKALQEKNEERARVLRKLQGWGYDIHGLSEEQIEAYGETLR